jgi:Cys-tRNA(Pro)/Cys-tRNA(Cys) deacylase
VSSTPAVVALERAGAPHTVHAYAHDPAAAQAAGGYGPEAAAALGVDPARVLKTLVADVDGRLVVAVCPVGTQLDLKAVAAAVGGKRARMADPADAQRTTGYVVGGISPLGQRRRLPTVVDAGAMAHGTVLVSAGRRGLDVELSPHDLVRLTDAVVVAVASGSPSTTCPSGQDRTSTAPHGGRRC